MFFTWFSTVIVQDDGNNIFVHVGVHWYAPLRPKSALCWSGTTNMGLDCCHILHMVCRNCHGWDMLLFSGTWCCFSLSFSYGHVSNIWHDLGCFKHWSDHRFSLFLGCSSGRTHVGAIRVVVLRLAWNHRSGFCNRCSGIATSSASSDFESKRITCFLECFLFSFPFRHIPHHKRCRWSFF